MNDIENEIMRLNFEDFLWIVFIFLSILNIVANKFQKNYVVSGKQYYEDKANNISIFVLILLLFVYIYFFYRNYNMYNNKYNPSGVDRIKIVGSLFFIFGTLCLLYFQVNSDDNFIVESEI